MPDVFILVIAMVAVGAIMGYLAGLLWKERPIGAAGDYIAAIVTTVVTGLLDWYIIPAMGFSAIIKLLGVVFEPPLAALIVLWIIRKAKQ